jgi:DNA-binding beta-propeller fold protein YncE
MKRTVSAIALALLATAPAMAQRSGTQQFIIVPLDVATVATGGTAVTALTAGHATAGGWIMTANAAGICVDQVTTAGTVSGTPSTTGCVGAGVPVPLVASGLPVSVNSTGSGTALAGEGLRRKSRASHDQSNIETKNR